MESNNNVTYSNYVDPAYKMTVLQAIQGSGLKDVFAAVLKQVEARLNRHEKIDVHFWYYPFVYIEVRDSRWKHYPCGHRMLVSFDLSNGAVASERSDNRYAFARKGWGAFVDRLVGRKVPRYKDCGQPEKLTVC